eukprot:7513083-Pyramimonas_sp.AAC.1
MQTTTRRSLQRPGHLFARRCGSRLERMQKDRGSPNGGDLHALRVDLRRVRRQGRLAEAGALEADALASMWTEARAASAGYQIGDDCPRCELAKGTVAHRLCDCMQNAVLEHERVHRAGGLCEVAKKDLSEGRHVVFVGQGGGPAGMGPSAPCDS